MKKKSKVLLSSLLSLLLIFSIFSGTAGATNLTDESNLEVEKNENQVTIKVVVSENPSSTNGKLAHEPYLEDEAYETQAIRILIYAGLASVGSYLVGEVYNGVITYFAGSPPSEWVVMGLTNIENEIKRISRINTIPWRSIEVSRNGSVYGCISYPCMVETFIDEEE